MANKITQIVEWKDAGGLKKIKQDVREAEGLFGKLKTGIAGSVSAFRQSNTAQAAALGGFGVMANQAINAASDLSESVNAVTVTYGENADAVLAIGENAATSLGLAKSEFNGFAVQYAAFVKQVAEGSGRSEASVLEDLTTRVADFASVMNLEVPEAAAVFQSALAGETEPIRRFGKDLSAAAVENYALKTGLIETKDELTEAMKVQARYGLLMEQTSDTAGDFANTSDGLANSQRILKARFKDTQAEIGENLLPAMLSIVEGLNNIITVAEKVHLDEVFDVSWAEDVGRTLGTILSPWNTGVRQANEAIVSAYNDIEREAAEFDRSLIQNATSADQVREVVERAGLSLEAQNIIVAEFGQQQRAAAASADVLGESIDGVTEAVGRSKTPIDIFHDSVDLSASALEDQERAAEDAAEALEARYGQALDNVLTKLDKATNSLQGMNEALDAQEMAYDYADALQAVEDAELRLAEVRADPEQGPGSAEEQRAVRDYERAVLRLNRQVLELVESYGDIPSSKLTEISLAMQQGDVDRVEALIAEITRDRYIKATVVPVKQNSFDQAVIQIANGVAPSGPTYTNPNPAPTSTTANTTAPQQYVDNSRTTIVYPVGTTPRSQRVDQNLDDRRNGYR